MRKISVLVVAAACHWSGVDYGESPDAPPWGWDGGEGFDRHFVGPQPVFGQTVTQPVAPPPISGGTLAIVGAGSIAVAADPDRDRIYVVDLTAKTKLADLALTAGDEPGRVIEDSAGRVHVVLRSGGAIV